MHKASAFFRLPLVEDWQQQTAYWLQQALRCCETSHSMFQRVRWWS